MTCRRSAAVTAELWKLPLDEQVVSVRQVLRKLVVAVKYPLLGRAEHDKRSPGFREPFGLKLMVLVQVGGVGKSCHCDSEL